MIAKRGPCGAPTPGRSWAIGVWANLNFEGEIATHRLVNSVAPASNHEGNTNGTRSTVTHSCSDLSQIGRSVETRARGNLPKIPLVRAN